MKRSSSRPVPTLLPSFFMLLPALTHTHTSFICLGISTTTTNFDRQKFFFHLHEYYPESPRQGRLSSLGKYSITRLSGPNACISLNKQTTREAGDDRLKERKERMEYEERNVFSNTLQTLKVI